MISDERLEDIADEQLTERQLGLDSSEVVSMAKELLALRKGREIPEGWKLVPIEPTEEMIAAGDQFMDGLSRLGDAYDAMLAAAPEVE